MLFNPSFVNIFLIYSTLIVLNVSPYPLFPTFKHIFPCNISNNYPIVILDGNAFGFIITSGITPFYEYGISYSSNIFPSNPFYACIDANLSPITGYLLNLVLTFVN